VQEAATDIIREKLEIGVKEPWKEENFQLTILERHLARESEAIDAASSMGKNRAFTDRAILDGYIYLKHGKQEESELFQKFHERVLLLDPNTRYDAVFYVPPYSSEDFELEQSEVRREDTSEAKKIVDLTRELYSLHYPIIEVPSDLTPKERARFILDYLERS
jgi:predicted ATPase